MEMDYGLKAADRYIRFVPKFSIRRLYYVVPLLIILLGGGTYAEEPLTQFKMGGTLSFPEDVQILPTSDPDEFRVKDDVSISPLIEEETIDKAHVAEVEATLALAKEHRAMVAIYKTDFSDDAVHIPLIRIDPAELQFKPSYGRTWVSRFTWNRNLWIEVRTTDDTLIGYTCRGCSVEELDAQVREHEETITSMMDAGEQVVEVNLAHDSQDILTLPGSTDKLYDPHRILFQALSAADIAALLKSVGVLEATLPLGLRFYLADEALSEKAELSSHFVLTRNHFPVELERFSSLSFLPRLRTDNQYEVCTILANQATRPEIRGQSVAEIAGLAAPVLSEEKLHLIFQDFVRTYVRTLATAIEENRMVIINEDKTRPLQMAVMISTEPIP